MLKVGYGVITPEDVPQMTPGLHPASLVYRRYAARARAKGRLPASANLLGRYLSQFGYTKVVRRRQRCYLVPPEGK